MSNLRTRKFVGQPKSALDFDWMRRIGKAVDSFLNGSMVGGKVVFSDGNVVWNVDKTDLSFQMMYPFKVYTPPGNQFHPSDLWRTLQVRGGFLGWRSKYYAAPPAGFSVMENLELQIYCDGTDTEIDASGLDSPPVDNSPYTNGIGTFELPNDVDSQITGQMIGPAPGYPINQILANQDLDGDGKILVGLWLAVSDTAPGPGGGISVALWARMWSANPGSTGRQAAPFPDQDPTIFPIGQVEYDGIGRTPFSIVQYVSGNLIYRHPANATFFRGFWTADALSGQAFWPGDEVVDDANSLEHGLDSGPGSFNYHGVFRFIAAAPANCSVAPYNDAVNWRKVGTYLI